MYVVANSKGTDKALQPVHEAEVRAVIAKSFGVSAVDPLVEDTLTEMQLTDCKVGDGRGRVFQHFYSAEEARRQFGRSANVRTPSPVQSARFAVPFATHPEAS